jgi:hypothetical protein
LLADALHGFPATKTMTEIKNHNLRPYHLQQTEAATTERREVGDPHFLFSFPRTH